MRCLAREERKAFDTDKSGLRGSKAGNKCENALDADRKQEAKCEKALDADRIGPEAKIATGCQGCSFPFLLDRLLSAQIRVKNAPGLRT
jgi:hypothetical protein